MDDDLLTTAEAARLAGVGTTSVKRWADLKLLPCVKTAGGHRRYRRRELERFLRGHGDAGAAEERRDHWLDLMMSGEAFDLQAAMLSGRSRLGAWYRLIEELGAAVAALGDAWRRGEITILAEHVASERLSRALARCGESIPLAPDAPLALLATAQGDDHTLGLSFVELCLREAGWQCVWSGRCTPIDELVSAVRRGRVRMLAVSASELSSNATALGQDAETLGEACREAGAHLILGGRGAWPDKPLWGVRVRALAELHELASRWR